VCNHGTYKTVKVINKQNSQEVLIDACIAEEIQQLNDQGILTLGCCCGHGKAGQIVEWENAFGKWKGHEYPAHTLIHEGSLSRAKELGYIPYPYYYADGEQNEVWQMQLKTGCITEQDCIQWHHTH
jgi:hypothetical protein